MYLENIKLEDLVEFQRGFDITKSEQFKGNIPVVSSSGINSYHNIAKNSAPGIVIGRKGTLGSVFYLEEKYWAHDTTLWSKKIKSDPLFIYYYLKLLHLEQFDVGGANPTLNRNHIHKLKIQTPLKKYHKKIGVILNNYDKLIRNNLIKIKLLEEKAQLIYETWFLRFIIDGKKLDIDKNIGLPFGWEKKSIIDFNAFKQDKSKVKEFDGEKRYLATADIDKTFIVANGEVINWKNKPSRAQISPSKNTVWFARMSNTYKVLCFTNKDEKLRQNIVLSSGFAGFKAKNEIYLPFLYCTINSDLFHDLKDLYATGATQVSLNNESMKFMKLIEPDVNTVEKFGKLVLPIIENISILVQENELLKESRDILLPRLMTGMIDVENMDIEV